MKETETAPLLTDAEFAAVLKAEGVTPPAPLQESTEPDTCWGVTLTDAQMDELDKWLDEQGVPSDIGTWGQD